VGIRTISGVKRSSVLTVVRSWWTWLPPPELERSLLRRAVVVSLVLHLAVAAGAATLGLPRTNPARPPVVTTLAVWAVVLLTVRVTLTKPETLLLGNLGVSSRAVLGVVLTGCAALEVVLRALAWAVGA